MHNLKIVQELKNILADPELFSSLDRHFAMFMERMAKMPSPATALAAALVSRRTGEGNICLDLAAQAGKPLRRESPETGWDAYVCPDLAAWTDQLLQSGVVGPGEGDTPLVLDSGNRLYLRRYWQYENAIIRFIRERAVPFVDDLDLSRLGKDLEKLFPFHPPGETDWQKVAAVAAVTRSFTVISGGPGTGKTTTVSRILALLNGQYGGSRQLRLLLGAPTGKAASRLQQAIAASGLLQNGAEPPQATTLHRMLGYLPNSPYFRHNAANPLAADVIVIDEVSMVDLPLLAKLMQAVPADARLILLGDRHQLSSVQPGSVLGDICRAEVMPRFSPEFCRLILELTGNSLEVSSFTGMQPASPSLQDSFVELLQNYRFSPESDIARLSMAVQKGDGDGARDILLQAADGSIGWSEIRGAAELEKRLLEAPGVSHFVELQQPPDPDSCFALLDGFRILCALRKGPFGMEEVNAVFEENLAGGVSDGYAKLQAGLPPGAGPLPTVRPFMVTRNDYNLQLFNGDVGIMLPGPEDQLSRRAFFRAPNGVLREVSPALLPGHETVFAMTVHKSQGSEFSRVLLILPDQDTPLLTRELLYTAITRARDRVDIWGSKAIFTAAVKRQIERTSGLAEGLWGGDR
jgi:exodeoxyribonuclease V alpha subunit